MNNEINYVSPFKKFVITIGNLPTAYMESMSYYEAITFLVNYLSNNVIPALNGNSEAIKELQDKYIELKKYVDDYFENLDVQEEINNKLDDMAESGQLTDIIAQYLGLAGMITFDTVTDMKAGENLVDGSKCYTYGYSDINDGGNAFYKVRKIINTDVVDERYLIALTDPSLVAELIIENNQVNIKQLGAKDDESEDIGSIINEALNKDLRVYVPLGNYLVTTTINPKGNNELIIDGKLTYTGNESCIKIETSRNIIKTKSITSTNGIPVLLENNDANATKCANNKLDFNGLISSTNNHAMFLHAIARGIAYNEIHFDTLSAGSDKYALYIKTESNGNYVKYVNENVFYGGRCSSGLYGIYIDTGTSGTNGECNGLKFYNIALEGITNGIYINNAKSNLFEEPRIAEINTSNKIITIEGNADGNIFNINSLIKASQININNMGTYDALNNFINGEIISSDGTRIGRNLITYNKKLQMERALFKYNYKNISSGLGNDVTFTTDNSETFILITSDQNPTIKLSEFYGSKGLNNLILRCVSGNAFTVLDSYGNTVYTYNGTDPSGYVNVICYNLNGTDTWIRLN